MTIPQELPTHIHDTYWTIELKMVVRDYWASGYSASQVVGLLNMPGLTRSAILGLCHRNGFKRPERSNAEHLLRAAPGSRTTKHTRRTSKRQPADLPEDILHLFDPPPDADFLGITLMDRQPGQCCFPRGDAVPYLFCGQPQGFRSSYCPRCYKLSVQTRLTPAEREIRIREYHRRMRAA